jgi:prepilin-type N-terminal cleavage/methylation domain-containing protein
MKFPRGFSLIEMAFVLVIVTLLLGGLLVPFATQVDQRRIAETQKAMEEIKEALLGFAVANGRLPCPVSISSPTSGLESPPCSTSSTASGFLPYATLGVNRADGWGHLYRYAVSPNFSASFALPSGTGSCPASNNPCGVIAVSTRDASGNSTALASGVVAIVISQGKNGYSGYNSDGSQLVALTDTTSDEYANAASVFSVTNISPFYSRTQTGPRAGCKDGTSAPCEFDDLLTWVSPNVLFNRMVAAGKLP